MNRLAQRTITAFGLVMILGGTLLARTPSALAAHEGLCAAAIASGSYNVVTAQPASVNAGVNLPGVINRQETVTFTTGTIVGTQGDDVIIGTRYDETILGLGGNDVICGRGGSDAIDGGDGNDDVIGDAGNGLEAFGPGGFPGNDVLTGGNGHDRLWGDAGFDALDGGFGDDRLFGGDGEDVLNGGDGNDALDGGNGDFDTCLGGTGKDTAVNCETSSTVP